MIGDVCDTIGANVSLSDFNYDFRVIEAWSASTPREVTIYNTGTENLLVSNITLPDTTNFSIDLNFGSKPVGSTNAVIPPGEKATLSITFTPKTDRTRTVDPQIASNIISKPVFHLPCTAIGVTNSSGEANAADGFITVTVYLSGNWRWPASDVLLDNGKANVATPIAINETKTVPLPPTLSIPAGTPVGTYHLLAVVDDDKEVFENNETNELSANTLTIASGNQVAGTFNVGAVGEAGNYLDVTFTLAESVTLVDVGWNRAGLNVRVYEDGINTVAPDTTDLSPSSFHWGDPPTSTPPDTNYQLFGYSATGFNSGDIGRITADLDNLVSEGNPLFSDYNGGMAKLTYSDGTVIAAVNDIPACTTRGAAMTMHSIFVALAIDRSAETGKPVKLPILAQDGSIRGNNRIFFERCGQ